MNLNPSQREAVNHIEGPLMVVAGPGTGKTQVLALRVANILKQTQMDPKNILALTFTESGVIAMRKRLLEIVGRAAYYVQIHTFHSFCDKAIHEFPEKFIFSKELRPLTDVDRVLVLQEIIDKTELDQLVSFHNKYYFLKAISEAIKDLKRENVLVEDFEKLISGRRSTWEKEKKDVDEKSLRHIQTEKELSKLEELVELYKAYQEALSQKGFYDFEDMIIFVVEKMREDDEFLRYYQELFQYILVDEYQDTNNAQNELVRLLGSFWDNPNIFVVGDDDQAIYRFQGASVENLLYLGKLYPGMKKIVLDKNYRSSQLILDAARSLIEHNDQRITNIEKDVTKNLKAEKDIEDSPIELLEFTQGENENAFLVQKIKELHKKGVNLSEIAVFVRDNADFVDIVDMFERHRVPYFLRSGVDILRETDIRKILKLLRLINDPQEDLLFFEVMLFDFIDIEVADAFKIAERAHKEKRRYFEVFPEFTEKLLNWRKKAANVTLSEFFEYLLRETGYIQYALKSEHKIDLLNKLNSLFSFIKSMNYSDHELSLKGFLKKLNVMEEHGLKIEEYMLKPEVDAVEVMTAHKAKGLEFEYVFLPKLYDGKWGNKRNRDLIKLPDEIVSNSEPDKKEQNEDERRLFYVALTRAKKQVFLSYGKLYHSFGVEREVVPSLFVSEIDEKYIKKVDVKKYEENAEKLLLQQIEPKDEIPQNLDDYLAGLVENFKLSVTALDTYLDCHRKFLYNNLLRLPRVKTPSLSFGTAVHRALELFFKKFKESGGIPGGDYLVDQFKKAINLEVMTADERKQMVKKGEKVLAGYFENYKDAFKRPMFLEYFFGTHNVYLGEVPLTGKLDKIELLDDVRRNVKVIDYKTGRVRSRNDIEGKTKASDGRYKRQVNFYKLLGELDQLFPFEISEGEFDFIEPNPSGKYKKESFEFNEKELDALKDLIVKTYSSIRDHKFEKTEDRSRCQKCEYRDICGR
ncbi:MAG: ATP-dependent DNA helicase [Patescibacteria group bacterium]|nr:ATP-dependent helicase [Patescibacteria group bacterium]